MAMTEKELEFMKNILHPENSLRHEMKKMVLRKGEKEVCVIDPFWIKLRYGYKVVNITVDVAPIPDDENELFNFNLIK